MSRILEALRRIEARPDRAVGSETCGPMPDSQPAPEDSVPPCGARPTHAIEPEEGSAEAPEVVAASRAETPRAQAPARVAPETTRPRVRRLDAQFVALAEGVVARLEADRSKAIALAGLEGVPPASVVAPLALAIVSRVTGSVVAVDADFRQPTLAERLDARCTKHERTLVDVLRTGSGWRNLVRPTRIARLGVVPGGRLSRTSARPAGQSRWESLLDELRRQYALILLDLGSLREPHAVEVTRYCEGTLLVATLGHTGRREAREAVRVVHRAGGTVWGAIVVDPR